MVIVAIIIIYPFFILASLPDMRPGGIFISVSASYIYYWLIVCSSIFGCRGKGIKILNCLNFRVGGELRGQGSS